MHAGLLVTVPCCGCAEARSERGAFVIMTAAVAVATAVVVSPHANSVRCEGRAVLARLSHPDCFPLYYMAVFSRSVAVLATSYLRYSTARMQCMYKAEVSTLTADTSNHFYREGQISSYFRISPFFVPDIYIFLIFLFFCDCFRNTRDTEEK